MINSQITSKCERKGSFQLQGNAIRNLMLSFLGLCITIFVKSDTVYKRNQFSSLVYPLVEVCHNVIPKLN